jgi:hypothetical protein
MMSFKCKECGQDFPALKSLHTHIKKHDMLLGEYYVKNYQRRNKLTGDLMQFKNYDEYFEKDFSNRSQLLKWCDSASFSEASDYIIKILKDRIQKKELKYAPNSIELYTNQLPPIDVYKKFYGSYTDACKKCLVEPMFNGKFPKEFHNDYSKIKIFIDTREQKPLPFKNFEKLKLDVGDYAVAGEHYSYTYVDRKSYDDFCNTMSSGYERFRRELERCRSLGSYLFIVIETDLYQMEKKNVFSPQKVNLKYVFHNMRVLQHDFKDCCQFVFSGNRSNSSILIPKLLVLGKKVWNTDIQYFLDSGVINYFERKES